MFRNRTHSSALAAGATSEAGIHPWPDILGIGETMLVMHATDSPEVTTSIKSHYQDEAGHFFAAAEEVLAGSWTQLVAHGLAAEVCFEPSQQTVNTAHGEGHAATAFLVINGLQIRMKPHRQIDGVKTAVTPVVFPDSERPHGAVIVFSPDRSAIKA